MATLHIMPVADLVGHQPDDACICGPTLQTVIGHEGETGELKIHHSLDGRELCEPVPGD